MQVTEFVNGNEDPAGLYVEGHHDAKRVVNAFMGWELARNGHPMRYEPERVGHTYLEIRPEDASLPDSDGKMIFHEEPSPGAHPTSVLFY